MSLRERGVSVNIGDARKGLELGKDGGSDAAPVSPSSIIADLRTGLALPITKFVDTDGSVVARCGAMAFGAARLCVLEGM